MPSITDPFPLSLQELSHLYCQSRKEISHLISFIDNAIALLKARMKPSAVVSARFNAYEDYYLSFLDHLKWKISNLFIDEKLPIADSSHIAAIFAIEYEHSRVAHPVGERELRRLRQSLLDVRNELDELLRDIDTQILGSVFMCHSSRDKDFVRKIARDLTYRGAQVWVDEAEIKIGDSLIQKITEGIEDSDFLAVILSISSVHSTWVQKELQVALTCEINTGEVRVLPILIEDCEIPPFLLDKKFADFRSLDEYDERVKEIVNVLRQEQINLNFRIREEDS